MYGSLIDALPAVLSLGNFAAVVLGVITGICIGALPGLSATMAISVLIPFTFGMDPPLAKVTLLFGPSEVFWVPVFGLSAIVFLLGGDVLKGLLSACFGVFVSLVGLDSISGYDRYTFGHLELLDGINIVVLLVGLYAIPPAIALLEEVVDVDTSTAKKLNTTSLWKAFPSMLRFWKTWLRSSVIGVFVGILPGALTLGIPGTAVAAVMLGGLMIHGLQPGPMLFRDNPGIVFGFMWQFLFAAILLIVLGGALATNSFAQVLRLPRPLLGAFIITLVLVGVYSINGRMFDVYLMLGFGFIGYFMDKLKFPLPPVVLGLILGGFAEQNLRLALRIGGGDWTALAANTTSKVLIAMILLVILTPLFSRLSRRKKSESTA